MGDFNVRVGKGRTAKYIGPHGLGERNERRERISDFALIKLPPRRLYSWKITKRHPWPRYDFEKSDYYILVKLRYRNSYHLCETYPGADIQSYHNPVVGKINLKLKTIKEKNNSRMCDMRKMKDNTVKIQIEKKLAGRFTASDTIVSVNK
jgi:hypothetical protein